MTPRLNRRLLPLLAAPLILPRAAAAQETWPTRPVRMVIGFPAGGSSDVMARLVAERLAARLGVAVVPENRPGGGAMIAAENVARAAPDGTSILFMSNSLLAAAATMRSAPVDVRRDLAPVSGLVEGPLLLVASRQAPFDSFAGMVAWAKANPGRLNVGIPGVGSTNHLGLELMARRLGIDITIVPYQGNAPALTALIRGDIPVVSDNFSTSTPLIRDGMIRPLAVTGRTRSHLAPEVPTVAELALPDYAITFWSSLMAPAATPRPIIERLQRECRAVMAQPDLLANIRAQGYEAIALGAEDLAQRITSDAELWIRVARESGITT